MKKTPRFLAFLLLIVATSASAQKWESFKGYATYYSSRAHGHMTASGERYDKNAFTCAHRTLPFGTVLRVTNLSNDSVVVVKVNDRGPFARGRVIDLSTSAARQLNMLGMGVAYVKVEVVPSEFEIWMERKMYKMSELPDYMKQFELDPPDVRMELQWPDDWTPQSTKKSADKSGNESSESKKKAAETAKRNAESAKSHAEPTHRK